MDAAGYILEMCLGCCLWILGFLHVGFVVEKCSVTIVKGIYLCFGVTRVNKSVTFNNAITMHLLWAKSSPPTSGEASPSIFSLWQWERARLEHTPLYFLKYLSTFLVWTCVGVTCYSRLYFTAFFPSPGLQHRWGCSPTGGADVVFGW